MTSSVGIRTEGVVVLQCGVFRRDAVVEPRVGDQVGLDPVDLDPDAHGQGDLREGARVADIDDGSVGVVQRDRTPPGHRLRSGDETGPVTVVPVSMTTRVYVAVAAL